MSLFIQQVCKHTKQELKENLKEKHQIGLQRSGCHLGFFTIDIKYVI